MVAHDNVQAYRKVHEDDDRDQEIHRVEVNAKGERQHRAAETGGGVNHEGE